MKWIIVLLVVYSLYQGHEAEAVQGGCPFNFIKYNDSNRCYFISKRKANFVRAKTLCESWNAELDPYLTHRAEVHLTSPLQSDVYVDQLWIGVFRSDDESKWTTTRHSEIAPSNQHWDDGYPEKNRNCVYMRFTGNWRTGKWRNADCNKKKKFVCATCPANFDYVSEINDCFRLNKKPMTWKKARKVCRKMKRGAHLLSIENKAKQTALKRYLVTQIAGVGSEACIVKGTNITAWLGGQTVDPAKCSTSFTWRQEREFDAPFKYTHWKQGLPNCKKNSGTCVKVTDANDFQWLPSNCASRFCSVCELD